MVCGKPSTFFIIINGLKVEYKMFRLVSLTSNENGIAF